MTKQTAKITPKKTESVSSNEYFPDLEFPLETMVGEVIYFLVPKPLNKPIVD